MTVWFISDLHLDASRPRHVEAFRRFLERIPDGDELFVLGDLFEVWVGDDDDEPFARSIVAALNAATQRLAVAIQHGNRDFLVGERFSAQAGVTLLADPIVIERFDKRLLLSHGDAWCTKDADYQRLRTWLRSPTWCTETLSKTLAERRAMAHSMRSQSRAANANKAENIMDVTEDVVIDAAHRHSADVVVHGHTHRPAIHRTGATRYVLGDWDRCGWTLTLDAGGFELQRFAIA